MWNRPLDTFGIVVNDQYSHLMKPNIMYKITNLWKYWLNFGHRNEKHPCCSKNVCAFRCMIKGLRSEVSHYLSEKLLLPQKLQYFRGSRFSQSFTTSVALHCSLKINCYARNYFRTRNSANYVVSCKHWDKLRRLLRLFVFWSFSIDITTGLFCVFLF